MDQLMITARLPAAGMEPSYRGVLFQELYQAAFPLVAKFVSRLGGSFQDAKDIFQDSLIIFYERAAEDNFILHTTPGAYLLGIAKHLWLRKFRKDRGKVSLDSLERDISIPEDYFSTPGSNRLVTILERTGKKCMDMLRAFYYDKMPLKDIAEKGGYANVRSATVQKFKCLEKVRHLVRQRSMTYEDFE